MSAADQMRAMIASMMGSDAITSTSVASRTMNFDDDGVCRPYLTSCCPKELLAGTKAVRGGCSLVHDPALKADFESCQSRSVRRRILNSALETINMFFKEQEQRFSSAEAKAKHLQTNPIRSAEGNVLETEINVFDKLIKEKLRSAEDLGAEGNVMESVKLSEEIEEIKKQREACAEKLNKLTPIVNLQQQSLKVCDDCGALISQVDCDRTQNDHYTGKLHLGLIELKRIWADLKAKVAEIDASYECSRDRSKRAHSSRDSDGHNHHSHRRRRHSSSSSNNNGTVHENSDSGHSKSRHKEKRHKDKHKEHKKSHKDHKKSKRRRSRSRSQ